MGKWHQKNTEEIVLCKCGCGTEIPRWKSNLTERFYVKGHEHRGRKQTPEHIKKRIKVGSFHWNWQGENLLSKNKGRRIYPRIFEGISKTILHFVSMCQMCMLEKSVLVHHIDGNTYNNEFNNLLALCKKCHHHVHHDL